MVLLSMPGMDTLRSRVIRLAHTKPELRPHLLPLLKTADDLSPEEKVMVLWDSRYERLFEGVLKVWLDRYDRRVDAVAEGYKKALRFWFFERKGNFMGTPEEEAPNFKGIKDALFHRRRKMLRDLEDLRAKLNFEDMEFLADLYDVVDDFATDFSEH